MEPNPKLSAVVISLMKGIVSRQEDPKLWQDMISQAASLQEYFRVMNLDLVLVEEEGFAFLQNRETDDEDNLPRLIPRRPLSYPVSLLLVLLRRRLLEHDTHSSQERLILEEEEIGEMMKIYFSAGSNEAKFHDQLKGHLRKAADLGFIRSLKEGQGKWEVLRVLKVFVDAQWLQDFALHLEEYKAYSLDTQDNNHE